MTARIDLVLLAAPGLPPAWPGGRVVTSEASPTAVAEACEQLAADASDAVLWWDAALGPPPPCHSLLEERDDVWHGGLALGQGGRPHRLLHVAPTWMFSADPPVDLDATSWRLSLRACLARTAVLRQLGGPDGGFDTISGAGLELGHRWISHGARCRHRPDLLKASGRGHPDGPPSDADELRIIERRFGLRWAGLSAVVGRRRWRSLRRVRALTAESRPTVGVLAGRSAQPTAPEAAAVSVIIPTVDRYDWLATVLDQLATQTHAPEQVIVVDQTPPERRQPVEHDELPLELVVLARPGQCAARNAALEQATGDLVLFIDDDDEIDVDLVERHTAVIEQQAVDVSSGVVREPGDGPPAEEFRRHRVADVFPTNNSMVRRSVLARTGWFDLAFDHGVRADHDLGTRLYLAGATMVLSPDIEVLHHRAPQGGLRTSAARTVTAASSRRTLTTRQPIAATEVYLWRRHHPDGVRAAIRLRLLGNLRGDGPAVRRLVRAVIQLVLLPVAARQARQAESDADQLVADHPTIPHQPVEEL